MANPYAGKTGGSKKDKSPTYSATNKTVSKGKKPNNNQKPGSPLMKKRSKDTHTNDAPNTKNQSPAQAPQSGPAPLTLKEAVNNRHTQVSVSKLKNMGY